VTSCSKQTNTLTTGLSVCSVPSDLGIFGSVKRTAVPGEAGGNNARQATLQQQDGWANAVAHVSCVSYDCCTGQRKVASKGARGRCGVTMRLTSDAALMCVRAKPNAQTHRTKKTRHTHNASLRPRVAACNASSMRADPRLTHRCPPTARASGLDGTPEQAVP